MSEHQEESAHPAEEQHVSCDGTGSFASIEKIPSESSHYVKDMAAVLEQQSHTAAEIPQSFLMDPQAFLPLNSDRLLGSTRAIEKFIADANVLIQGEIDQIQRLHKKIAFWEDKIAKNRVLIDNNRALIQKNTMDIVYDRKNRDHWWGRAELVYLDYQHAEAAGRKESWGWLIKKWGLKNADGTSINASVSSVEELCQGKADRLMEEYRAAGNRYEEAKKEKESESYRLIRENTKYLEANETLQSYIASTYSEEIEPYQDGVLLLKELVLKLKTLEKKGDQATYGDLRIWADSFLNDFLKSNPRVSLSVVTEFRKIASIPLPGENC